VLLRVTVALSLVVPIMSEAGAPRSGNHFTNQDGPRRLPGLAVMLPFLAGKLWASLVPRAGAARLRRYDSEAILHNPSVTWIGHSTMLVRMDGVSFVTDPMFSERASPLPFGGPKRLVAPGVPLQALPRIDFVTVSHDHYDHLDLPSIAALARRGTRFIVPLGIGALIREAGGQATELDWWQSTEVAGVRVHCVPAQHFSGRSALGGDQRLWAGWVVEGPTRRFYHAGDTASFDGFTEIGRRLGPIDLATIPIGAYDPAAIMRAVHLNPEEAVQAAVDLGARKVLGMHWGTFDLADEPIEEPPRRFLAAAAHAGLGADRAWIFDVGETRGW